MLRVLDDTGTLNNYEYNESIGFFRNYGNRDHNFVFDMNILPNYSHFYFSEPPG
jgi:hypothetical protein